MVPKPLKLWLGWLAVVPNIPPAVVAPPPKPPVEVPKPPAGLKAEVAPPKEEVAPKPPPNPVEAVDCGVPKRPPVAGWAGCVEPENHEIFKSCFLHNQKKNSAIK